MGITIKDIFLKVLLRVKEMNLIVWHRLAFEELANDLIADLKEVGNDRIAINELFHMVKKAQTAGQESSLELYERGLQEITSDGTNLKNSNKCQIEARYLLSDSSCYAYNRQHDKALQTINEDIKVA